MESKIMRVYYGNDCLPYKDSERTVHYPIVGGAFIGASNTTEIRFYFKEIGSMTDTFVANAKLPNGKIINQVLENDNTSDNEPFAKLSISSLYTQHKGDVFISLCGYSGGITLENVGTELEPVYQVNGEATIQATGSIKIGINYAVNTPSNAVETITVQEALGLLTSKLNIENGIVVLESPSDSIISYENGQLFFSKSDESFYIKEDGSLELYYYLNEYRDKVGLIKRSGVISSSGLSEVQLLQAKKQYCFMLYTGINPREMYVKVSGVASGETETTIKFVKLDDLVELNNATKTWQRKYKAYTFNASDGTLVSLVESTINSYTKDGADYYFANLFTDNVFEYAPQTNETIDDDTSGTKFVNKNYVEGKVNDINTNIGNVSGRVSLIEGKIPEQASSLNQLVDENTMNSTINSLAAFFRGNFDNYQTPSEEGNTTLMGVPWQTQHKNQPYFVSNNDYAYINDDETHNHEAWRYIYVEGTGWQPQFRVNEAPLTADQLSAINSGITATLVGQIGTNQTNIATINTKLPRIKGFVVATTDWQLNELDNYDTFTDTSDYIGYYVIYNSQYEKVTNDNKDNLSIIAGSTIAYTGKFFAQLSAGNDFVINDNDVKIYSNDSADDQMIKDAYGINVSSDATTQKFTFTCTRGDTAPDENVNFTITMIGGN